MRTATGHSTTMGCCSAVLTSGSLSLGWDCWLPWESRLNLNPLGYLGSKWKGLRCLHAMAFLKRHFIDTNYLKDLGAIHQKQTLLVAKIAEYCKISKNSRLQFSLGFKPSDNYFLSLREEQGACLCFSPHREANLHKSCMWWFIGVWIISTIWPECNASHHSD